MIQLRLLIPCSILGMLSVDLAMRALVPSQRLAFRWWEPAVQSNGIAPGPFRPNLSLRIENSYGDLPNVGNLPSIRQYHSESFTSDRWGFRCTPSNNTFPLRVVVVGDSFAAGAGLSDDETLSAQIAAGGQIGVYNGGGLSGPGALEDIGALIRRLKLRAGLVVYEQSERSEAPEAQTTPPWVRMIGHVVPQDSPAYQQLRLIERVSSGLHEYSPLRILIGRGFSSIRNDVWLPNVAAKRIVVRKLENGQQIAFLASEVENFTKSRAATADFFAELQALVRSTGNELLVILVPDKYNVYYPLLQSADAAPAKREQYLSVLSRKLAEANVRALDLTTALREQASALIADGQYNYRLDDTHWNALGVHRAAKAVIEYQSSAVRGDSYAHPDRFSDRRGATHRRDATHR